MQLDEGFYLKLNNIDKVSVNIKVFVCIHGVCSLFSLSLITLLHKSCAWVALSLNLQLKKEWTSMGLKNELGLTPYKAQRVGLQAFVGLGAPGPPFFKHKFECMADWQSIHLIIRFIM